VVLTVLPDQRGSNWTQREKDISHMKLLDGSEHAALTTAFHERLSTGGLRTPLAPETVPTCGCSR
jgi:hypothetical protein